MRTFRNDRFFALNDGSTISNLQRDRSGDGGCGHAAWASPRVLLYGPQSKHTRLPSMPCAQRFHFVPLRQNVVLKARKVNETTEVRTSPLLLPILPYLPYLLRFHDPDQASPRRQ